MSYFRFWPSLPMAGFSRTGRGASSVVCGIEHAVPRGAADGDVIAFVRFECEGVADDFGAARRDVRRFGVDADQRLLGEVGDQLLRAFRACRRVGSWRLDAVEAAARSARR